MSSLVHIIAVMFELVIFWTKNSIETKINGSKMLKGFNRMRPMETNRRFNLVFLAGVLLLGSIATSGCNIFERYERKDPPPTKALRSGLDL